ncbi:MAG: hypothetical protein IT372_33605 [Polyangiaceae bacterium]|nr:hypothetical protein [Polyangiaceae bacterium]
MERYFCLFLAAGLLAGACGDDGTQSNGGGSGGAGASEGGGGAGGSGGGACAPGETATCYTGPDGTDGVGTCHGGTMTCNAEGTGFGPCEGEVLPALERCTDSGDEDCNGQSAPACTGDPLWSKRFGGPTGGVVAALAVDGLGDVVIGGGSGEPIDFGDGALAPGPYLVKLGPDGSHLFSRSWTGFSIGTVAAGADGSMLLFGLPSGPVNLGGGVLTGGQDFVAGKLDAAGNHVWSRRFTAGGAQNAWGLAAAGDDCYLAGWTNGSVDLGGGAISPEPGDITVGALGRLDAAGDHVWSRSLGDSVPLDLVTLPGGGVAVTGFFFGSYDFGGGAITSPGPGSSAFVVAYDADGSHLFSKALAAEDAVGTSIAVNAAGEIAVAGWFDTSIDLGAGPIDGQGRDMFVVKLTPAGDHVFGAGFGDAEDQIARGVAIDGAGAVFFTGGFPGTVDFGGAPLTSAGMRDVVVVRLDPLGHHDWSRRYGDEQEQFGRDMALSPDGDLFLTGVFSGTLDFIAAAPLTSVGESNAFVAKLAP